MWRKKKKDSGSGDLDWFPALINRLQQDEADAVIAETVAALEQQPDHVKSLITLAMAHNWSGDGEKAEPYARKLLDIVQQRSASRKIDGWSPLYVDWAYLAVSDAMLVQGRFLEAARVLEPHTRRAARTNMWLAIIAFAYFLAGDRRAVRRTLDKWLHRDPYGGDDHTIEQVTITDKYRLMVGYYIELILPNPRRFYLPPMRRPSGYWDDALAVWENEARRHAHNPYGKRLTVILADLRRKI